MDKVLFLTTIGGFLQQFEMNDVGILQEMGYEIHYASNLHNPVYNMDISAMEERGIRVHHIDIQKKPSHIWKNGKALIQLLQLVKCEQIRVIHCHNPMGGVLGRLISMFKGCKIYTIYTAHGFHFYKGAPKRNWIVFYPVEKCLAKFTDCLITINKEDYEKALRFSLRKGGHVFRIPGVGIHTKRFAAQEGMREQTRKKFGIPDDVFYLLSVGELNQNKNHIVILRAMAKIPDKKIWLGICGKGHMEEELEAEAKRLGIKDRFTLFGFRNDIPQMLSMADCFVFPSLREGLGIAAIEAMAAGVPLITSDCRGTREYARDQINGLVCVDDRPEAYAEAIIQLRDDAEKRHRMSEACVNMSSYFDISATDSIMRQVYKTIPPNDRT